MAGLRLESDRDQSIVGHLEEFSARVALVLIAVVGLTAAISLRTDAMLMWWLGELSPCDSCMVVYEPGAWIGLRWTFAIVCSAILCLPLLVHQSVTFASPGLLPLERKQLRNGMVAASLLGLSIALWFGWQGAPWLYEHAMTSVEKTGLVLALDSVSIVELTLAIMWILALLGATSGASLGAGVFGRLDRDKVIMWRWRVSLPVVLLIVTSTWTTANDLRWPLAISSAIVLELPLLPWRNTAPRGLPTVLDADGARRRLLVVDCACEGAFGAPTHPPETGLGHHVAQGLCARYHERTSLLERIQDGRASDVLIVGCTSEPLPPRFKEAVASAGATLRGLDLRSIEHRRPSIEPASMTFQRDLSLSGLVDPWSESAAEHRTRACLESIEMDIVDGPMPTTLHPRHLWLERDPR